MDSQRRLAALPALAILAACQGGPLLETTRTGAILRQELVGTFEAISFTATADGAATDILAAGGSLTLDLALSSEVSGRLVAPGLGEAGADVDEDMAGSWTFDPITRIVRFAQNAETFVAEAGFVPSRTEDLSTIVLTASAGSGTPENPAIEVVLERQ